MGVSPWDMLCTFLTLVLPWPLTYMWLAGVSLVSFTHSFYLVWNWLSNICIYITNIKVYYIQHCLAMLDHWVYYMKLALLSVSYVNLGYFLDNSQVHAWWSAIWGQSHRWFWQAAVEYICKGKIYFSLFSWALIAKPLRSCLVWL